MAHRSYALARVAVLVRAPGRWLWWLGSAVAAAGAAVPGLTGRRIGVLGGAALFLLAAGCAFTVRRARYRELAEGASRAGRTAILQDRRVSARVWWRNRRSWVLVWFALAAGSVFVSSSAGGMALAGAGAGLWLKSVWLGRWEREHDALVWIRPERAKRGPVGKKATAYELTGPLAGDAAPGGGRRGGAAPAAPRGSRKRRSATAARAGR